jgi:hypothetical protein
LTISCEFRTPLAFDIVEFHFNPENYNTLRNIRFFNEQYDDIISDFESWIDQIQERGSGFVFDRIIRMKLKVVYINQMRGSSYLDLPFKSKSIINIQNTKDNKCFLWCLLAHKYYDVIKRDRERVSKYVQYENEINMEGIEYPIKISDIPKIERLNNLNINVFAIDMDNYDEKRKRLVQKGMLSNSFNNKS